MRSFIVACIAAIAIAAAGGVILHQWQKSVDVAFSTSAVRI
jgi:hypothetical protein